MHLDPLTRYSRPSMKDLNKHVIPLVSPRWYDLGLELLETKHERELDIIETNYRNDVVTSCRKMLSKWLETQSDSASWDQLIQAVKSIEMNDVANDIEQLLLQGMLLIYCIISNSGWGLSVGIQVCIMQCNLQNVQGNYEMRKTWPALHSLLFSVA